LSGSEFFGHERGAFTGAVTSRDGAFAMANNGTLFLDEVGELPLKLQAQLLRVVQEKTFKRVGGNTWHSTNFRLVCATNKDLMKEVQRGEFRSDLYYRIANWTCTLPPLRDRREDIIPLARHFISRLTAGSEAPALDNLVLECLLSRTYPGNVRDLKQLISRIMCRYSGKGMVTVETSRRKRPQGAVAQR
jgi:transcriptional regulator with GAF, ATPase, and Fis domain